MANVLAVMSSSNPIEVETFSKALGPAFTVSELEIAPGSMYVSAEEDLIEALEEKVAVVLRTGELTERVIESADDLGIIAVHGSGYDHVDVEAATRNGVLVTHNPEAPGPAVIEHTVAMMITLLRRFPERFERAAGGEWSRETVTELRQQTVGVVGLGYIGSRVARAVSETFGATVLGYDPYVTGELTSDIWPRVTQEEMESVGVEFVDWFDLFERSDIVTLHTALTDRTNDMVGMEELEALEGDFLINTARGRVVDEDALREVVMNDRLGGAALDVLADEPPSVDNPLLDHPDVYVTPHIASATDAYPSRAATVTAEKIKAFISDGTRPETVVNPSVTSPFDRE